MTETILTFCEVERSKREICEHLGFNNLAYFARARLNPLLDAGRSIMTIPDTPSGKKRKHIAVEGN